MPVAVRDAYTRRFLNIRATGEMIEKALVRATNFSLYAFQEEIANGYIHCKGGLRIGVAGRGVVDSGKIAAFKDITSLNIRVPHEVRGCADKLSDILKNYENTLIIAPPFAGKTTLIREMARILSSEYDLAVIDEREEICGGGAYTMGKLCDVVSGVPKSLAYEGIIRALSPEIIVLDELFPEKDEAAVFDIARSGVKFLASLHGDSIDGIAKAFPALVKRFTYGVLLGYKPTPGSIKSVVRFRGD